MRKQRCGSNLFHRSRDVAAKLVQTEADVRRIMTVAALMSNHGLEGEESSYAGEAHIGGVEQIQRQDFKKLSKAFNDRVFGAPHPADEIQGDILPVESIESFPPRYRSPPPPLLPPMMSTSMLPPPPNDYSLLSFENSGRPLAPMMPPVTLPLLPPLLPPMMTPSQVLNPEGFINKDRIMQDLGAGPVLLALRPGLGKTQLILELMHPSRLLLIVVPTKALQQQV
jgi:hypothetical protein